MWVFDGDYSYKKYFKEHIRYDLDDNFIKELRKINSYDECHDCALECKFLDFDLDLIRKFNDIMDIFAEKMRTI